MSIPKLLSAYDYTKFASETNPTTVEEYVDFVKNQYKVLASLTNSLLWQPSSIYSTGKIIVSDSMVPGTVGIVTTAGTTATVEPTWTDVGTKVSDNSVSYDIVPLSRLTATQAEAAAGTDIYKVMTPALVKSLLPIIATAVEAKAGINDSKMMTPLKTANLIDAERCIRSDVDGNASISGTFTAAKVVGAYYADYAEFFPRGEETEAGDIVAALENSFLEKYGKATAASRLVVGIHSDNFSHIIGGENVSMAENMHRYIPVALAGRVKCKVKGAVHIGDAIVQCEDVPGVGRVLTAGENSNNIVGRAVEDRDDPGIKKVKLLVRGY